MLLPQDWTAMLRGTRYCFRARLEGQKQHCHTSPIMCCVSICCTLLSLSLAYEKLRSPVTVHVFPWFNFQHTHTHTYSHKHARECAYANYKFFASLTCVYLCLCQLSSSVAIYVRHENAEQHGKCESFQRKFVLKIFEIVPNSYANRFWFIIPFLVAFL